MLLFFRSLTLMACTLAAAPFSHANPLLDAPELATASFRFARQGQGGNVETLGDQPAFNIFWDGTQTPYGEVTLRNKTPLPDFIQTRVRVNVFVHENNQAASLNLRIRDSDGEIFQLSEKIPDKAKGWTELAYIIDKEAPPSQSWGKTKNDQLNFPLRLEGFGFHFKSRQTSGQLGIGKIEVDIIHALPEVALETGNPIHVLKPGEEQKLGLRIVNNHRRSKPGIVEYTITGPDWDKPAAPALFKKIELNDGGDMFIPLPPPPAFGVYKIDVRRAQDGHADESTLSYAYMVPAGPTEGLSDGFIFGVCGHPQRYGREEQEREAMAAAWCGAKAMREDIGWGRIQPRPDEWHFESFDFVVDTYGKYNIEVMPIYTWTPGWAVAKGWKPLKPEHRPTAPPDLDHWRAFVRKFTGRYRDRIRFGEIWNEPDHYSFANFPASQYIEMLEIGYDEIKKTAPHWNVFNGGITTIPSPSAKSINPETLPLTIRSGKYDIFAFHGHGVFPGYKSRIERLAAYGNTKPWYANETAVSSTVPGENVQARTLFQKLIFSWSKGAVGYNWYNLRNKDRNPRDNEHNFGMLTHDFHPKPVYAAYNALALFYGGARFVSDLSTENPAAHLYLFKGKSGDYLIPSWTSGETDLGIPVSNITGKATSIDLWGNETPLSTENGKVILPISREPSTLRIVGQSAEPAIAKAAAPAKQAGDPTTGITLPAHGFSEQPTFVLEGSSQVVSTMINDPTTAHLFWNGPDDLSAQIWVGKTQDALKFRIVVRDDIHVDASKGASISDGDSAQVMLDLKPVKQDSIWDFAFAHRVGKSSAVQVLSAPKPFAKESVASKVTAKTSRDEATQTTLYELEIPFSAIGLNRASIVTRDGIGLNVMVNDNDSDKRESFMSLVPDEERFREAEYFPTIRFDKER